MVKNYNKLTAAETERLALLAEEAGEVIQIIGKILRHGYQSYHPDHPSVSNRQLLEKELGDLQFARQLMLRNGDISRPGIIRAFCEKFGKIGAYLHHQKKGKLL